MTSEARETAQTEKPTPTAGEAKQPPAVKGNKSPRKQRRVLPWIEPACAVCLVFITGFYTYYAHQQVQQIIQQFPELQKSANAARDAASAPHDTLGQLQKQNELLSKQLEGTQAGVLRPVPEPLMDTSGFTKAHITLMNMGAMSVTDIRGHFVITRISLPSMKVVGSPMSWDFFLDNLPPDKDQNETKEIQLQVTPKEAASIKATTMSLRLEGTLSYQNGFRERTIPICKMLLWVEAPTGITAAGTFSGPFTNDEYQCSNFVAVMNDTIKRRGEIAAQKKR